MKEVEYNLLNEVLTLRYRANALTAPGDLFLITEAANAKNIALLTAAGGEKIGYVVWGMVDKYIALNIVNYGIMPRHFYEFSSGKICLILQVFSSPGRSHEFAHELKSFIRRYRAVVFYKKHKSVFLMRNKNTFYKSFKKKFSTSLQSDVSLT